MPLLRTLLVSEDCAVPLGWRPQQVLQKVRAITLILVVEELQARFPAIRRLLETTAVGAVKTGSFASLVPPKVTLKLSVEVCSIGRNVVRIHWDNKQGREE